MESYDPKVFNQGEAQKMSLKGSVVLSFRECNQRQGVENNYSLVSNAAHVVRYLPVARIESPDWLLSSSCI